jgi:hypothetical protein
MTHSAAEYRNRDTGPEFGRNSDLSGLLKKITITFSVV